MPNTIPKFKVGEDIYFAGTKIRYKVISIKEVYSYPDRTRLVYTIRPHKKDTAKGIITVQSPEEYLSHA